MAERADRNEPDPRLIAKLKAHFAAAEGSHIQRACIATAMSAIEHELVETERAQLPTNDQMLFMMTYECFVMWALKMGIEPVLERPEVESAIVAMQEYFARHAWYKPGVFEAIWKQMQEVMPMALRTGDEGTQPYPAAEMLMAPSLAGYSFSRAVGLDLRFGIHVALEIARLAEVGEYAAKEHLHVQTPTKP
jgi:hypothetical protein